MTASLPITRPKQARSRQTFEKLLSAAQDVLANEGIASLNSNVIVERAGLTPPAFYRYFRNKHELLAELGHRLMERQNAIIQDAPEIMSPTREEAVALAYKILDDTVEVTRNFTGGFALLISLRAIPELSRIRLESHARTADLLAARLAAQRLEADTAELDTRARLAIEMGYAAVEMLFETEFRHRQATLNLASEGICTILGYEA